MEARVNFTKEFDKMTKTKISPQRKGELRWERLEVSEKDGVLQQAKSRYDIAEIAGITDRSRGYGWVANLISKGNISETMRGVENGKFVYEYHLTKRPLFKCGRVLTSVSWRLLKLNLKLNLLRQSRVSLLLR